MDGVKKFRIFNAFLFICGWLVSFCALAAQSDNSKFTHPIIVRPSAPMATVRLPANPSTGYQWMVTHYEPALMMAPSHHYVPQHSGLTGAPGYDFWQFKFKKTAFGVSPKTSTVIMEYRRPWEQTRGRKQIIRFTIKPK